MSNASTIGARLHCVGRDHLENPLGVRAPVQADHQTALKLSLVGIRMSLPEPGQR